MRTCPVYYVFVYLSAYILDGHFVWSKHGHLDVRYYRLSTILDSKDRRSKCHTELLFDVLLEEHMKAKKKTITENGIIIPTVFYSYRGCSALLSCTLYSCILQ